MAALQTALILSDNYLFSEGLKSFLRNDCQLVTVSNVYTYEAFESSVQSEFPSLVIVDYPCEVFKLEKVIA